MILYDPWKQVCGGLRSWLECLCLRVQLLAHFPVTFEALVPDPGRVDARFARRLSALTDILQSASCST